MRIKDLLKTAREIWGPDRLTLGEVIVRLGVDMGDLARWERNADKDRATHTDEELKKELGNVIFSMIRWADDLGYDPEECVARAVAAQRRFAESNKTR